MMYKITITGIGSRPLTSIMSEQQVIEECAKFGLSITLPKDLNKTHHWSQKDKGEELSKGTIKITKT